MSIKIMAAVFESETLGPTERLIMLSLADHADDAGRCYPSISRLCKRTGLTERTVQTNIRKLQDQGYVTIIPSAGQGGANVYIIRATPAADAPPQQMHPREKCTTPPHLVHPTPAADAPKPSRTITEPSEEPPLVPPDEKPVRRRAMSLPPNWVPNDRNIADALSKNFTEQEISHEAELFRDYHLAKGTTFKDWDAGWRTWLSNARRFGSASRRAPRSPSPLGGGSPSGIVGAAMRSRAARGL